MSYLQAVIGPPSIIAASDLEENIFNQNVIWLSYHAIPFLRPQYSSRVEGRAIEAQQRRGQNYKKTKRKGRKKSDFTTVMKNKNTDIYKVSVNDCQKDKQKTYDQQGKINCGASSEPDFIQNYFCNQNFWEKRYLLYNNTTFSRFWS